MKRRFTFIMAMALAWSLTICAGWAETAEETAESLKTQEMQEVQEQAAPGEESLVGMWVFTGRAEQGGTIMEVGDDHRDAFMLELRRDGTLTCVVSGTELTGTWTPGENTLTMDDGQTIAFSEKEDGLHVQILEDFVVILARTEETLTEIRSATASLAEKLAGRWRVNTIVKSDGTRETRWQLEERGFDETVTFTADGSMLMSTWQNGKEVTRGDFTYTVASANILLLDGNYQVIYSLSESMLTIQQRGGTYYYLPDNGMNEETLDEALVGRWRLEAISDLDGSNMMTRAMMDQIGMDETLEFMADGRSIMTIYDHGEVTEEPDEYRWAITTPGVIVLDGAYVERYTLEEDRLTLMEPDTLLVFVRMAEETTNVEEAAAEASSTGETAD